MRYVLMCGVAILGIASWHALGFGSTEPILASGRGSVTTVDCARFEGSDAGEIIQACLDALPSGGIADARGLTGAQVVSHTLRLNHEGTVLQLGTPSTFTLADGVTLDISASNVRIEGEGATTGFRLGNGSAVRIGSRGQPIWDWRLERIDIEPAKGRTPLAGLLLIDAREGIIEQTTLTGFPGSAIDVGDNCWSNRSIDNNVVKNDIGYSFHGNELNAWNLRGGFVNSNRIGLKFDLGKGDLQGFSITDGTQMEDNKETAIALRSGEFRGLFLSNVYSELFASERLIKAEPGAAGLRLNLLSIVDTYVYSKDTPPVLIRTGPADIAIVNVSNLVLRHSQQQMAVAEAAGANTSIVVSDSISYSSTNDFAKTLTIGRGGAHVVTVRGGSPVQ